MLCYDLTDIASLENLNRWRQEFLDQVGSNMIVGLSESAAQFPFVVLGNKSDKVRSKGIPSGRIQYCCGNYTNELTHVNVDKRSKGSIESRA